jgi:uncharacterized protein
VIPVAHVVGRTAVDSFLDAKIGRCMSVEPIPTQLRVPTAGARRLSLLEGQFAVCRLPACAPWPVPRPGPLLSITRTAEETSVVCLRENAPRGARVEDGWRALKLEGPIPFEEIGVLSALAGSLAGAGLSVFALSTFDTDYILVKETSLAAALEALGKAGFAADGAAG